MDQLDRSAGRINWMDQLDRSAGWISWMDQLDGSDGQTSSLYLKPWPVSIFEDSPFSLYIVTASESKPKNKDDLNNENDPKNEDPINEDDPK